MRPNCVKCHMPVNPEERYRLANGRVAHTCCYPNCDGGPQAGYCHISCRHSWAEDNIVEAAAPAIERSKHNG